MFSLFVRQLPTHATGRSASGCVCSAPADQCVPALTTMWPTTARARRGRAPRSRPSVSPAACAALPVCTPSPAVYMYVLASPAPPSGPCDIQCQNGGSCFLNAHQVAKCRCQPSYTGERCEINQCRDYCKNGGTCAASHTGKPGPSTCVTSSRGLSLTLNSVP